MTAPPAQAAFPGWTAEFHATLGRLRLATRQPAHSPYPGAIRSTARGRAIEFADYRPYVPGDEPRLVDWHAYARHGRLYVKRHDEERERSLTLLVDVSASLDFGADAGDAARGDPRHDAHKGRYARRLAAALATVSLAHHEPVRTWLLHDGAAERLAPALVSGDTPRLFGVLAAVRESGATGLAAAVTSALREPCLGPVVLLSDLLDETWPEALRALAPQEAIVLQTLAREEWEPALGEEVELEDVESGDVVSARLGPGEVDAYRERLHAFLADVAAEARRYHVLHVALRTDAPLAETVLRRLPAAGVLVA